MKWIINTLMSAAFFVISIAVLLLVFNSFMTIAVAQSNRMLDSEGIGIGATSTGMAVSKTASDGQDDLSIGIARTEDNGILIQTKDGSMKLNRDGIELPGLVFE
ncbi:MAG: hypothetical protein ABIF85_01320 [Nanoarchaeota archaeon]|nr:hypothetical protein [Nanoarchaeota archaeon]MBU4451547.1 hypothetical protein [Nanoarchaeota archaeon]MCG2724032.1 hypothetical protein [archaeon]